MVLAAVALAGASPAAAGDKGWADASDAGVAALALWSIGVPLASGDNNGALQAAGSFGGAEAVAQALKATIRETRPDGSNRKSFPSGHSSMAFAAASSILERRGPEEGVPALALAGFVGLARVEAHKHYWHDVAAGAAIGTAAGLLVTHPLPGRQAVLIPYGDAHGGGATFAMAF